MNLPHDITAIGLEITQEVKTDKDGKSTFTISAVARLLNVERTGLGKAFLRNSTDGTKTPSKLALTLEQYGFQPGTFSQGIPDTAVSIITQYVAFNSHNDTNREHAKQVAMYFAAIGVRVWAQQLTGWTPEVKPDIDPQQAIAAYIMSQIPEHPSQWTERYPKIFWSELERLYGLKRGDRGCASVIHNYIYRKFPEAVRDRLDEINPLLDDGNRARRQHQHFDGELLSYLVTLIQKVVNIMQVSDDAEDFKKRMRKVRPLRLTLASTKNILGA